MTAAQRIKDSLIDYLADNSPDESIAVVDARQRGVIELPTLTVDVTGTAIHSTTLANVTQAQAQIVLRCHTGDEDDESGGADPASGVLAGSVLHVRSLRVRRVRQQQDRR